MPESITIQTLWTRVKTVSIDCMYLADQIEIADTEPEIQAEDVA